MVDGVRTFDPVGAFQRGRRGAQQIAAEEAAAPRRNQLQDLNIEQAQQTLLPGLRGKLENAGAENGDEREQKHDLKGPGQPDDPGDGGLPEKDSENR